MSGLGMRLGLQRFVQNGANVNQIPLKSDALFWLDGVIVDVAGTKYFRDKTTNDRKFLITGYDFDTTWVAGMPYKTAATISAPAADAALIAADINNYLYASNGTPNQIPVVSLFQDVDYEHRLFCRHFAQVLDENGVETNEPRVLDIVLYANVKATTDLAICQAYYSVPVENTTTMVWLSPTGNDTTGNGSKASPYRSLGKIQNSTKTVVYCKSGDYSTTSTYANFTGASELILQGLGYVTFTPYTVTYGVQTARPLKVNGFIINNSAASYTFWSTNALEFNCCKITATNSIFAISRAGMETKNLTFNNCNLQCSGAYGLYRSSVTINSLTINNCIGIIKSWIEAAITDFTVKHSKVSVPSSDYGAIYTLFDSKLTGAFKAKHINYSSIIGNVVLLNVDNTYIKNSSIYTSGEVSSISLLLPDNSNFSNIQILNNDISGSRTTEFIVYLGTVSQTGVNGINGLVVEGNKIENRNTNGGVTHTLFVGGGINQKIRYNKITATNGYAIVIKSGDIAYTTTDIHIGYNIIDCANSALVYVILVKGASGVIIGNNTIINTKELSGSGALFGLDGYSTACSALYTNNLIKLSGNVVYVSSSSGAPVGSSLIVRNNTINKNGFTCTIPENNFEITTAIDTNGIPAAKIEHAEEITGVGNNVGLATDYVIPTAITYQNQGETWQNGAVILP